MTTNDIDAIRKLTDATSPAPWFYNSYSAVLSGPKVQPHDEWLDTTGEHSLERHGSCEACGLGAPRGCQLFSEDYKRDAIVAHVPAHHGDTAVGERAADAEFIAAARTHVPALCDEVEQLRADREKALDAKYAALGEVGRLRAELAAARDMANTAFNDAVAEIRELYIERDALRTELSKARKDRDDYADDNTRVAVALVDVQRKLAATEAERDAARDMANTARHEATQALHALDKARAVVEAAKTWRAAFAKRPTTRAPRMAALIAAVDALPTTNTDDQPCCGYRCQDNTTGVTA